MKLSHVFVLFEKYIIALSTLFFLETEIHSKKYNTMKAKDLTILWLTELQIFN